MEEVDNLMGQAQVALSSSPSVLEDSITSSVPDNQTEAVLEESNENITSNSVICLDDEDDDDYDLPELPRCLTPIVADKESSKDNKDSNDDDFSIVYEKIVPPPDVQIVQNNQIEHSIRSSTGRRKHSLPTNSDSSHQDVIRETISEVEIREESSLDDSVSIINDECTPSYSTSTKLRSLRQAVFDSAEKKKRKIECAVCFDGPDEIYNSRRNLVSTICGHIFCDQCLKNAITFSKKCPQCRKKLTAKQYHPIYL